MNESFFFRTSAFKVIRYLLSLDEYEALKSQIIKECGIDYIHLNKMMQELPEIFEERTFGRIKLWRLRVDCCLLKPMQILFQTLEAFL